MASTVVTSSYRSDLTRLFVEDVFINDYYLFVSSTANTTVANTNNSKRDFLEKTLYGKKIDPDFVFYMIRNYPWEINTVYTQYDDTEDLAGKRYYVVVYPENNQTGDYRIYKCLFNNYGARSVSPPPYDANRPNQIYQTADGYIWKYMYELSVLEFERYNTLGYIPIIEDVSANNVPETSETTSTIDQVFVTNQEQNRGYESVSGAIFQVLRGDQNQITFTAAPGALSEIDNYYSGYTFYVTNFNNVSQLYEVDTYEYDAANKRGIVTLLEGTPTDGVLINSANYRMVPKVRILGDGSGARGLANVSSEGVITNITMIDRGSDYTSAIAEVVDPYAFDPASLSSLDERALLRPVLSPKGGHASNLIDELGCKHSLVFIGINEFDNAVIPTSNEFASIGIVKNPEFKVFPSPDVFDNRIELALDSHNLVVNEIVTQIETSDTSSDFYNRTRFSGKVHSTSNNFVYLCEYMGPYPNDTLEYANTDFSDVSLKITLPILSSQNEILVINTDNDPVYPEDYDIDYPGFNLSPYVQRSGEVIYMNRFSSVSRTSSSNEQFKILLEF
jgi:hypothetical protein